MPKVLYFHPAYMALPPVLLDLTDTAASALVASGAGAYPVPMPLERVPSVLTPSPVPTPTPSANELFMVAGQSLAGTDGLSASTNFPSGWAVSPRVQMWDAPSSAFVTYNPANPPKTDPENASNWGPELAYATKWLADTNNAGKTLYIVKHWQGGAQLGAISTYGKVGSGSMDWAVGTANGNWKLFKDKVLAAKAALTAAGIPFGMRDAFWLQGETDSRNTAMLGDYVANCSAVYQAMRTQLADSNLRIVAHYISQYYSDYPRGSMAAKQREIAAGQGPAFIIDTLNFVYATDQIHWGSNGANKAGATGYDLTHGENFAPATTLLTTGMAVPSNAAAGASVGHISASVNGRTAYAVISNTNFEFVGSEIRVATGATLAAGTVDLTIRATNAGGTRDYVVQVTVSQASSSPQFLADDLTITPPGTTILGRQAPTGNIWRKGNGANDVPAANDNGDGVYSTALKCVAYNDAPPPGADYSVEIKMVQRTVVTSQTCGAILRCKNDAETYFYARYNNTAGAVQLGRILNGSVTSLGTDFVTSVELNKVYTLRIQVKGQLLEVWWEGAKIISATDNSGPTLAGFAGMRMSQSAANATGWHILDIKTDLAA